MLERKLVTILFADLVGSTSLASELDAEQLREVMARYHGAVSAEVRRYGGTIEKFIGDAAMAVFGFPQTHEDDPVRAVRAAFAMRETVGLLENNRLRLRIGIYTGDVVADSAVADRGEFLVTGEAVHLAQRLQAAAEAGEIVVGARTWKDAKEHADFEELPTLTVKGAVSAVRAFRALRLLETPTQPVAGAIGFVGRVFELALLQLLFDKVCAERRPHLVTLIGPPGIGKTRLTEEFRSRIGARDPTPVLRAGTCKPYGESWLYCPIGGVYGPEFAFDRKHDAGSLVGMITDSIRRLCAESSLFEVPAERLARIIAWCGRHDCAPDPPPHRDELFRAWRFPLEVWGPRAPVVVTFDNLQWSSDEPLDFIESLPAKLTDRPVLVVAVARPELLERRPRWGGGGGNATTLQLGPLSADETRSLVTKLLDAPVDPVLIDVLEDRAEGNPHFVLELIRMLVEEGVLAQRDGGWKLQVMPAALELPDTVHAVIAARIDRLPPTEKRTLLLASYAAYSRKFWDRPLRRMGDLDDGEVDAAIEALLAKGLILENPSAGAPSAMGFGTLTDTREFTFSHGLLREVAHEMVPKAERPRLHLAFADWLQEITDARPETEKTHGQIIAHHIFEAWRLAHERGRADGALAERALGACLHTAEIFTSCRALRECAEQLRRAAQIARATLPQREPEVLARLAEIEHVPVDAI